MGTLTYCYKSFLILQFFQNASIMARSSVIKMMVSTIHNSNSISDCLYGEISLQKLKLLSRGSWKTASDSEKRRVDLLLSLLFCGSLVFLKKLIWKKKVLAIPKHVLRSYAIENPSLHEHLYDPIVLLHLCWQPPFETTPLIIFLHSSTSETKSQYEF